MKMKFPKTTSATMTIQLKNKSQNLSNSVSKRKITMPNCLTTWEVKKIPVWVCRSVNLLKRLKKSRFLYRRDSTWEAKLIKRMTLMFLMLFRKTTLTLHLLRIKQLYKNFQYKRKRKKKNTSQSLTSRMKNRLKILSKKNHNNQFCQLSNLNLK